MTIMSEGSVLQGRGDCPSREELFAFHVGKLTREDVAKHIEDSCPRCEAMLQEMDARSDPLIAALQGEPPPLSRAEADDLCQQVLQHVPIANPAQATTIEHVPPADAPSGKQPGRVPPALPETAPSADLPELLRKRLLFVAALLACLFAIYVIKLAVYYEGYQFYKYTFDIWVRFLLVHSTIFLSASVLVLLLWSKKNLSVHQLRLIEMIIVGLPLLDLIWVEYQLLFSGHRLLYYLQMAIDPVTSGRNHALPWFALIIGYGVLIPNKWWRCYLVVSAFAGTALAMNIVAAFVDGVAFDATVLHHLLEVAIWLGFAVAFAVYAAHYIDVLRRLLEEVIEPVDGRYRLLERLGGGGMGDVYLALDQSLPRLCAIKLIRPERALDPQMRDRFKREVRELAKLTHPNTIRIFDYGQDDNGTFYYAMEYLPGLDLDKLVKGHGPLPPARVVFLLRQVCSALAEVHKHGLIHRDIKPSNIFVCEQGGQFDVAKLLDLGLVSMIAPKSGDEKLTQKNTILGTAAYMSTEQARGSEELDRRCDLYSLGATAYFLLTGRPPFVGASPNELIIAHARDRVEPPSQLNPGIPKDLERIVLRCLKKKPEQRFQSAADLEEALASCACAEQWTKADAAAWWREQGTTYHAGSKDLGGVTAR
jgi:serine/threonine-protein kinase